MSQTAKPVVLCIDDDASMLDWIRLMLDASDYQVRTETNSLRALEAAAAAPPDLILLDVTMPELDGYKVCERLQERPETAYVPVIFVTGLKGEGDRARAFMAGAVDYLVKPLTPESLLETVAKHAATRQKFSQVRRIAATAAPRETVIRPGAPSRWDDPLRSAGFSRFKEHLSAKLRLPADRTKALSRLTATALYSGATELGISGAQVADAMAEFLKFPRVAQIDVQRVRLGALPTPFCMTNHVLAVSGPGDAAQFVLANPFHWEVLEAIRGIAGHAAPALSIAPPSVFESLRNGRAPKPAKSASLSELHGKIRRELDAQAASQSAEQVDDAYLVEESGPLVALVHNLIDTAYEMGASDIHIEPTEEDLVVRYRIDGDLHIVNRFKPAALYRRVIARLKVMSNLDLTEHRLPQDGRIPFKQYSQKGLDFDLRLAVIPVNHGEKACLRILDRRKSVLPLERLGFSARNLEVYREKIRSPHGMILHVGPTGSGKSMSLYAALNEVKDATINIQTAEDPIEYTLPEINQLQVFPEIGLTFSRALRSFLRVDPDVILVGEIRDTETAKTAVEAALTGHLLLSTLHTNDAAATVVRLIEMGIEPYLVSSSLVLICAQRLLRRLCTDCREEYVPDPHERDLVGAAEGEDLRLYRARGCARCNNFGYKGRTAVHEILAPNDGIRQAANRKGISSDELKQMAIRDCGMVTLYWDAMEKVRQGTCSLKDALQNVRRDDFDVRPPWAGAEAPALSRSAR